MHSHAPAGPAGGCPVSSRLYRRGCRVLPGGLTRSTIDLDPHPIYMAAGKGAYVTDVDGNRFLDLNNNFTTLIHGHGYEPVADAVSRLLRSGTCFANPTEHEIALAELLVSRIPAMEQVRFVNTGTEAVMFALKAARAFTGRPAIVRFSGAYHGAYDWAENGQNGLPSGFAPRLHAYRGAPESISDDVVVLDFNRIDALEDALAAHAGRLAAILIDPVPSRAGLLAPLPEFLERLSSFAHRNGTLIIADEVLNLRQGYQGASARFGLRPDLITAGKIIGGGFPIGAIGGRAEVMQVFRSDGKSPAVPQGGTFAANPVSMVAGLVAMEAMTPDAFIQLEDLGNGLRTRLTAIAARHDAAFTIAGSASLFRIHAKRTLPTTYADAFMSGAEAKIMRRLGRFFLRRGVLLPFGAAACLSTAMTACDIDAIAEAFEMFITTDQERSQETQS